MNFQLLFFLLCFLQCQIGLCKITLNPSYSYEETRLVSDHRGCLVQVYNGSTWFDVGTARVEACQTQSFSFDSDSSVLLSKSSNYIQSRQFIHTVLEYGSTFCTFVRPELKEGLKSFLVVRSSQYRLPLDSQSIQDLRIIQSSVGHRMFFIYSPSFQLFAPKNLLASRYNVLAKTIYGPTVICPEFVIPLALFSQLDKFTPFPVFPFSNQTYSVSFHYFS